jgi:hypothetical protein
VVVWAYEHFADFEPKALLAFACNKIQTFAVLQKPRLAEELCSLLNEKTLALLLRSPYHRCEPENQSPDRVA